MASPGTRCLIQDNHEQVLLINLKHTYDEKRLRLLVARTYDRQRLGPRQGVIDSDTGMHTMPSRPICDIDTRRRRRRKGQDNVGAPSQFAREVSSACFEEMFGAD
jgi:hypothetical protein